MGAGAARSFRSFVFSMRFDKQAIATVLGRQVVSEARIFAQAATANFAPDYPMWLSGWLPRFNN